MPLHRDLNVTDGIHVPYSFVFANTSARDAYTPTENDVGKVCRLLSDGSFYILKSHSPVVWAVFGTDYSPQPLDATLTALAEVSTSANTIILATGADTFSAGQLTDAYVASANKDGTAGTPSLRTLGTGAQQAAAGDHTHSGVYQPLDGTLTALAGVTTSANSLLLATGADTFSAGQLTDAYVASANKDGTASTPSLRTLGTGAQQAAAGNHTHSGVYEPAFSTLGVNKGGTGATTLTGYVYGNGTGAMTASTTIPGSAISGNIAGNATNITGIVAAANGGTGNSSYSIGDILYASGSSTLSKLAGVATGNALVSGGVGTAPSWAKIGLTTHVSGVLPIANGGTNSSSLTSSQFLWYNGTSIVASGYSNTSFAGLNSPAFTGTPTAPTAPVDTNSTQIATTAFVISQIADDAPTKTGSGASGTWGINITGSSASCTGNAATATTAYKIRTSAPASPTDGDIWMV